MNTNWIDIFMKQNGLWKEHLQEVEEKGRNKSSAIARLIYACEIGDGIDQHVSEDLKEVSSQLAALRARVEAAEALITKWNEQAGVTDDYILDRAFVYETCADELAAALKAGSE